MKSHMKNKSLVLNKETIVNLSDEEKMKLRGGKKVIYIPKNTEYNSICVCQI
jgi:hypothetical protein